MVNYGLPVNYQTRVNAIDGMNQDIRQTIHENFYKALPQTREIAPKLKGSSRLATAFNLWRFLKENVKYVKDPETSQRIRLPGRLIADREGDCKSFSLFIASVLKNLGMPVMFRYASYRVGGQPTHVYVVTKDRDGSDIIIDAVYKKFNAEVPYKSKIDTLMKVKSNNQ